MEVEILLNDFIWTKRGTYNSDSIKGSQSMHPMKTGLIN